MMIRKAEPGECVDTFARYLLALANEMNEIVLGEFNQHTLDARPGMTLKDVLRAWSDADRESYFGGRS